MNLGRTLRLFLLFLFLSALALSQTAETNSPPAPVFRGAFTLKLHTDRKHYYEQHFESVPYVFENVIYLFVDEHFGVNVTTSGDEISSLAYQPDPAKADVEFKFWQQNLGGDRLAMMLEIHNNLKRKLFLDAEMIVPGSKGVHKTSILPVGPGLSDYETWPHPIVQLALGPLRFAEKPSAH